MKLLVIGHSVEDHIHLKQGEVVRPGGIFYSALGLKSIAGEGDEIYLLTSEDRTSGPLFAFLYDGLNRQFFQPADKIPRVHLYLPDNAERCENYENIAENLDINGLNDLSSFDGILINMITGFDLRLEDLIELRKRYSGLIYLDVHTLARGLGENNQREFRPIPQVEKWISCVDILQVNENELLTLSEKKDEMEIAREVLSKGPQYLIVTKGDTGSKLFAPENGGIKSYFQSALKVSSVNKIGCGDIFGAVFFYSYIKNRNFSEALKLANTAAGCAAGYSEFNDYQKLKYDTFARFD
ncbi:MAG: carbohydrate kinase family protein [Ignavibacteriales bacterium]